MEDNKIIQTIYNAIDEKWKAMSMDEKIKVIDQLTPLLSQNETKANGILNMIAGGIILTSGSVSNNTFQAPLEITDASLNEKTKRGFGIGVAADSATKNTMAEQFATVFPMQRLDDNPPSDWSSYLQAVPQTSILSGSDINIQHATYNYPDYNTFFWGRRYPIVATTEGRIITGASVLTDLDKNWVVNELAGAILNISSPHEAHIIASNTANTITINGTFSNPSNSYTYDVGRPIYMGTAQYPWRRLYLTDDIRFGIGPTAGAGVCSIKYGTGSPEAAVTANIGSLYLRQDGGAGTCLYVKESGTNTNTGWIPK